MKHTKLNFLTTCVSIVLACVAVAYDVEIKGDAFGLIVSVYAIVSALLFGAVFSIFSVAAGIDRKKIAREFENVASFKRDLRQINRYVIYLVAISTVCVLVTLVFSLVSLPVALETWILIFVTSHFFFVFGPLLHRVFVFLEFAYRKL